MPPTIISRCQSFIFKRINDEEIIRYLSKICSLESLKIDDESLKLIARNADGSLRDAIGILDQVASLSGELIKTDDIRFILGISENTQIYKLFSLLAENKASEFITRLDELINSGYDLKQLVKNIIEFAHKILLVKIGQDIQKIAQDDSEGKKIQKLAQILKINTLLLIIRAFLDAEKDLKQAEFPQIPIEIAVLQITTSNTTENEVLSQNDEKIAKKVFKKPNSKVSPNSKNNIKKQKPIKNSNQMEYLLNHWHSLINWSKKQNHSIATLLSNSVPIKIENGIINLVVKFKFHADKLNEPKTKILIEQGLNKISDDLKTISPELISDENKKLYLKNKKIINSIEAAKGEELINNVKEVFGI